MLKDTDKLVAGDRFPSPREEEGVVTAVCDFGNCIHQGDRPDSIHVRDNRGGQFFIALPPDIAHVCSPELVTCLGNIMMPRPYDPSPVHLPHSRANRHLG